MSVIDVRWMSRGSCYETGADPFYYESHGSTGRPISKIVSSDIESLCQNCPVLAECREYAILHEVYGYWGGLSARARRNERTKRRIRLETVADHRFISMMKESESA